MVGSWWLMVCGPWVVVRGFGFRFPLAFFAPLREISLITPDGKNVEIPLRVYFTQRR